MAEVMAAILYQEPSPLRRYTRDAPAELERIVGKALQKDREERYQVIKDLLLDLKGLRLELEVEAKLKRAISPEAKEEAGQIAQPPTTAQRWVERASVQAQAADQKVITNVSTQNVELDELHSFAGAKGLSKNNLTICQKTFSFGKPHSGTIWQIVPLQIVKLFLDKP